MTQFLVIIFFQKKKIFFFFTPPIKYCENFIIFGIFFSFFAIYFGIDYIIGEKISGKQIKMSEKCPHPLYREKL